MGSATRENMKTLIIALSFVGITFGAFGQGQVILANNSSSLCYTCSEGQVVAAPVGSMFFQLSAGVDAGSLTPIFPIVGTSMFVGRIASTVINISIVPPGATATFQIRAWSSQFATYELAANSGMGFIGQSVVFTSATSANVDPPPIPVSLAGKFPAIYAIPLSPCPIPEPSTIALAMLGASSLLVFGRNKRN